MLYIAIISYDVSMSPFSFKCESEFEDLNDLETGFWEPSSVLIHTKQKKKTVILHGHVQWTLSIILSFIHKYVVFKVIAYCLL